jgi:hypothetical protein
MTDESFFRPPARVRQIRRTALIVGVAGLVLGGLGAVVDPRHFYFSWLIGFTVCLGLALGSLGFLMVQYLTGGAWGVVTRRISEAAARTLPLVLLFFVPLLIGMPDLYPWSRPDVMAGDPLLQKKALYLNVPFFVGRAALYFGAWLALLFFLTRWARRVERDRDAAAADRLRRLSAGGILIYGFTITFASVDWLMSLEPHWFSSIFGLLTIAGQGLAAIAFANVVLGLLASDPPFSTLLSRKVMLDVGNLMLAFVMLWAYMAFSQFLIIWSGNLPEEIPFYVHRLAGSWEWIALALVVFHFAVPFVALLMRATKRVPRNLAIVAAWVIAMRWLDAYWLVGPEVAGGALAFHWLDVVVPAGMLGLWVSVFAREFGARPVVPVHEAEAMLAAMEG